MKTLLLMRHAKSSWANEGTPDFQRPLNNRGERDAPRIGAWMQENGHCPEVLFSSTSTRTRETAALFLPELRPAPSVEYFDDLYHADVPTLTRVIQKADSQIESLMVLAHNPGMEQLISSLKGKFEELPTSALAVFQLDILGWDTFSEGSKAMLLGYVTPHDLA